MVAPMKASPQSTRSARRSQVERREESDRRMLRAASELIARQGLSGTTLADIGQAAGYSRGLPVWRYGSKLGLIAALLESMDGWLETHLAGTIDGKQGVAALRARIAAHLEAMRGSPIATSAFYCIFIESLFAMPELKPHVTQWTDRWRKGFAADVRAGQARGEIRTDIDADEQATLILCSLRGLIIDHMMDPETTDLHTVDAALSRIVDAMLCTRRG
jgi:AcrR family transcriptional regulator